MRIAVLTSGGDAPGMNATIRAVVRTVLAHNDKVFGVYDGFKGLIEGRIVEFNRSDVSTILNRGGTILGTARLPEFKYDEIAKLAIKQLVKLDIDALICIGGDGTYRGAQKLSKLGFPTVGIPATIDNDVSSTDFTIGFSTALATACDAIDKLRDTSSSHQRCSIIEVMGRDCGDLALYSGICCGAEYIITKDTGIDKEELLVHLKENRLAGRKHAIIVISEKITDVHELAKEIEDYSGYECRAQVLGYIQRGGNPTAEDRLLAARMGKYAVDLVRKGVNNVAIGVHQNQMVHIPFEEALAMTKTADHSLLRLVARTK
jgi:6-phosphofructokinase 1